MDAEESELGQLERGSEVLGHEGARRWPLIGKGGRVGWWPVLAIDGHRCTSLPPSYEWGGGRVGAGSSQRSRRGLGHGLVELELGNSRGTGGIGTRRTPTCALWRSECATSGIDAFSVTRGTKRKKVAPLGSRGQDQDNQTGHTQKLHVLQYKIFRKPRVRQVFDEMTEALHISEKSQIFCHGLFW